MVVIKPGEEFEIGPDVEIPVDDSSPIRISLEERRRRAARARHLIADIQAIESGPGEVEIDILQALDEAYPGRFNLREFDVDGDDPA